MEQQTPEQLIELARRAQAVRPRPNWRSRGSCLWSTQHFFTEPGVDTSWQQILCRTCPVQLECLQVGLAEPHGVWGGTSEADRELIRQALGVAVVESSLDELVGLVPEETPPEAYLTFGSDNDRRVARRIESHLTAKEEVIQAVDDLVANGLTLSEAARRAGRSGSWLSGFKRQYPDVFDQILAAAQQRIDPAAPARDTGLEAHNDRLRQASEQEAAQAVELMVRDSLTMTEASRAIGRQGTFLTHFKHKNPAKYAEILAAAKSRRAEAG